MTARLLAVVLSLLLAACQPLPHPFARNRPPQGGPITTLRDTASITVAPVAGLPAASQNALAAAMVEALQEADILATTQIGNRGSYRLIGAAQPSGGPTLTILWRLLDPGGHAVGQATGSAPVAREALTGGDAAALKPLAAAAVPDLARLLEDEPLAVAASAEPVQRQVAIRPVTGAPGDGREALARALAQALTRAKIAVLPGESGRAIAVVGTVSLGPSQGGRQQVKIAWAVLEPGGKQLGVVSQENAVPAGSLDRAWGDVASAVAEAATPGILALIDKAEERRAGT